jgi:hypothetical protein
MTLRSPRPSPAALPIAAAVALLAGAALAQPYDGPQTAPPIGQSRAPYAQTPSAQPGGSQAELASLHASLRITAAQESAWRAFVAASGPDAQQQARERAAQAMLPSLTAPQRVDLGLAAMEADLASFRERGAALKAFYASLTPDQRTTFDRETLPRQEGD